MVLGGEDAITKGMSTRAILIGGQTVLPDDNGSFDDVRSVKSTGRDLVALFVARSLPVVSTFLTSSNDPLSSGNTVWQCLPPEQTLIVYQGPN